TRERETARAGDAVQQLADHATVRDDHDTPIDVRGDDALEAGPHARIEVVLVLTAGDHVPALLLIDAPEQRIAGARPDAQFAAFPTAEEPFAQVAFLDRLEAEASSERRRGLVGALERRDVDRVDALVHQPIGEEIRLLFTDRIERRIAVAVAQRERLT